MEIELSTPLDESVRDLSAGQRVYLSGVVYVARDQAHRRMMEDLDAGRPPFPLEGQVIYYAGPSPTPPGRVIGSMGPTTSGRMDPFTVRLLGMGLKGMIGKGKRSLEVLDALASFGAVYFGATGGAAALLSRSVVSSEVVAYGELGPEAVLRIEVRRMPLLVIADSRGGCVYDSGPRAARAMAEGLGG
ncbi:MAG: FumA C-terminus/TtdB family hydratase beta subunit [Thermanaerothrix sp.]|nr:FumA C-terminus/TtdB family hydratase beta subunit [Thermanaerothrix sp.]